MSAIHASQALLPEGWGRDVRITVADWRISTVEAGVPAQAGDERCAALLPGIPNLHSHAFQRGMAGLAEVRGPQADSFWSWRDVMYRFALTMTPDQMEAIAAQLYVEMVEAGFTRVGEFHYLHHAPDGRSYDDRGELAARIAQAADTAGIALTLLPVFYAHSTFGGAAPTEGQRRFIHDLDGFARLVERCRALASERPSMVVGVAPHSLRAVTPEELGAVVSLAPRGPLHIHIAEQRREVADCLAWSGARPVDWLLDHAPVDGRWTCIHATHMTDVETLRLARTGAIAGLCPVTEANLGDGTFPASAFLAAGGRYGIGTDSNILIGVPDELRQLEYSQRLATSRRNVLARAGGSTGRALVGGALDGGVALGVDRPAVEAGAQADLLALAEGSSSAGLPRGDALLDAWIFTGGAVVVDRVWVAGRRVVEGGHHHRREAVRARFRAAMAALAA